MQRRKPRRGRGQRHDCNDAFDADIAWSPDGQLIAYETYQDGNDEIYVVGRTGTGRRNLTRHPASDFQPHWGLDAGTLLFASDRSGEPGIYEMDFRTGEVREVRNTDAAETSPPGDRVDLGELSRV